MTLARRTVAEALGTAFLLAVGLCPRFPLKRKIWCFHMFMPAVNDC